MKRFPFIAFAGALLLHASVLLFGGLLLPERMQEPAMEKDVGLVEETPQDGADRAEKPAEEAAKKEDAAPAQEAPAIAEPSEPMPDLQNPVGIDAAPAGPALDALSLSDLESALQPGSGDDGSFGAGWSLASGGRIGAAGGPGGPALEEIAGIADLDQRPSPVAQSPPMYPQELRRRRVEGSVSVVFVVDVDGRVLNPSVEKSTDPAFERPALEAVRRWRFEPGTRQGHRVQFKMRVPITFRAS